MSRRGLRPLNIQTNVLLLHNSSYFFRRENILKKGMITKPIRAVIHDIEILLWKYLVLYIVYYIHTRHLKHKSTGQHNWFSFLCLLHCLFFPRTFVVVGTGQACTTEKTDSIAFFSIAESKRTGEYVIDVAFYDQIWSRIIWTRTFLRQLGTARNGILVVSLAKTGRMMIRTNLPEVLWLIVRR